jgi:hypothetical protein
MSLPRLTTRRWMIAIVITAIPCSARSPILEAYYAGRFHKGWDTCDVTGAILSVNQHERLATLSTGSDDGIACGETLYLFREGPAPQYLGKARIISVKPESAVGRIVAGVRGHPVREGDQVARLTWVKRGRPICGYRLRSISRETEAAGSSGAP